LSKISFSKDLNQDILELKRGKCRRGMFFFFNFKSIWF